MASEILIRFSTLALDKAKQATQAIQRSIRQAIRDIDDPKLRKTLRVAVAEEKRVERQRLKEERFRLDRFRREGERLNAPQFDVQGYAFSAFTRAKFVANKVQAFTNGRADIGDLILDAGGMIPGPIGRVFDVVDFLKKYADQAIKERAERKLAEIRSEALEAVRKITSESFFSRFEADPDFRTTVSMRAFAERQGLDRSRPVLVDDGAALGD